MIRCLIIDVTEGRRQLWVENRNENTWPPFGYGTMRQAGTRKHTSSTNSALSAGTTANMLFACYVEEKRSPQNGPDENRAMTRRSYSKRSSESGWPAIKCVPRSWWRPYRYGCRSMSDTTRNCQTTSRPRYSLSVPPPLIDSWLPSAPKSAPRVSVAPNRAACYDPRSPFALTIGISPSPDSWRPIPSPTVETLWPVILSGV